MAGLVIVGAGPIGTIGAEAALEDGVVDAIVAVVDPDERVRRELVAATGSPGFASTVELPRATPGDIALVAFASSAEKVSPEIIRLVSAGYDVVTTCEGLAWAPRHIWDAMHTSARSDGRTIIVTGTNPGFVMDRLPLLVATASRKITRIHVERHMDTSGRRPSLVAKSGRGLSEAEFRTAVSAGRVGAKGLDSSARLIARGLEWPYREVLVRIEPIMDNGHVAGSHHTATLSAGEDREVVLDLVMSWGLAETFDRISVDGIPPIVVETIDGFPGDEGTAAQVVGAIRRMSSLAPGFYRPTDIPLRYGVS